MTVMPDSLSMESTLMLLISRKIFQIRKCMSFFVLLSLYLLSDISESRHYRIDIIQWHTELSLNKFTETVDFDLEAY